MRKKTINRVADTIFWYVLYFLPVVIYLLYIMAEPSTGSNLIAFSDLFNTIGIGFVADNIITSALASIFGVNGVFPIFSTNILFELMTWFIGVYIVHLAVDFLIFIPRLAHKWLNHFTKTED